MHRVIMQNKFLRKVAEGGTQKNLFAKAKSAWKAGKSVLADAKDLEELLRDTGVDFRDLQAAQRAGEDIQNWQAGKSVSGYNPLKSFATITKVTGNPKFSESYAKWSKTRANHKWRPGLENALKYHNAMSYAQANPSEFRTLLQGRGMTPMSFIFDSADNNYRLMKALNSPLGIFLNSKQRSQARNNFGLMELIWRIKKFFSEFGNWRYQADPSKLYRSRPRYTPGSQNTNAKIPAKGTNRQTTQASSPTQVQVKLPLDGAQGLK